MIKANRYFQCGVSKGNEVEESKSSSFIDSYQGNESYLFKKQWEIVQPRLIFNMPDLEVIHFVTKTKLLKIRHYKWAYSDEILG